MYNYMYVYKASIRSKQASKRVCCIFSWILLKNYTSEDNCCQDFLSWMRRCIVIGVQLLQVTLLLGTPVLFQYKSATEIERKLNENNY